MARQLSEVRQAHTAVVADEVPHAWLLGLEVATPGRLVYRQVGPLCPALVLGERRHEVSLEVALAIFEIGGQQPWIAPSRRRRRPSACIASGARGR
jgi:hypothetical protein